MDGRQEAGLPVDVHRLVAPRGGALATVVPCQAIVVPTAVVRLTPNRVEMAAVFATDERRGMRAGSVLGVEIDLVIALENDSEIDPAIDPVIAPESDTEIGPVPLTGIKMRRVRRPRTTVQGPGVFRIGMIVMATADAPGMNGDSRPSAPERATTLAVPRE